MPTKTVALFVDVESLHGRLRSLHHRSLDPAVVHEAAQAHGRVAVAVAVGDWRELPEELKQACERSQLETVQVDRARGRDGGGRRREVVRDMVDLEILARMIETLFVDGGPEIDAFVLGTSDDVAVRAIRLVRERFAKEVHVVGVEGAIGEALSAAATDCEVLAMPAVEPQDPEGLSELVPLLEGLERRKRYLNYKYIRESATRKLACVEKSAELAERLLSDAIACGLLLKIKVEDKYNPGQLFTAYQVNRDSELFATHGSGEPAPDHDEASSPPAEDGPAVPTLGRAAVPTLGRPREASKAPVAAVDDAKGDGKRRKRRRRRRSEGGGTQEVAPRVPEPTPATLSAGSSPARKKKRRGKGNNNHHQDRVGRSYEAPSRFLPDPSEEMLPLVEDDDLDEEQILAARGDRG